MQSVKNVLTEKITCQNTVFVFPTDIACQKWADWAIKNTSVKAVAMERFLAWDKFKGECIRSKVENLRTVPSLMRKIFVCTLIEKNSKEHFFKSIINQKYASTASSFVDWISSILPSLQMWKNLREKQAEIFSKLSFAADDVFLKNFYETYSAKNFTDEEDSDFQILYDEYSNFLSKHNLFDPAWVEPDFSNDGREYFLVYPETLEDWEQYRFKLSSRANVHFINVPEGEGEYESYFFENSGQEIRDVSLFLHEMHDENKIEWRDMAVNVPNMDNFSSYLDRAFSLYEIPHTMRYSRPLSSYGAGSFFSQLQECVEKQFSYESIKNLLLNEDIPWNNKAAIENLLLFGRMNNCICTSGDLKFEKGRVVTVWDEAFKNPKDDKGTHLNSDELIKNLYRNLVDFIIPIVNAKTFKEIRLNYEKFRELFFDMASFQEMELSNNVLSRCISSLNEIVDLEKDFPDYAVASPFSFFVSHLSKVQYLSQGENRSVQVYPFRTAAAAPYKVQVVIDSTQDSLSVADSFKPLDFLNENKRLVFLKLGELDKSVGFSEIDPTFNFVKLYQHSSLEKSYFTSSRHAYNGEYGFVYGKMSKTNENNSPKNRPDSFLDEKKLLLTDVDLRFTKLYSKQEKGLSYWKKLHISEKADSGIFEKNEKFSTLIKNRLHFAKENLSGHHEKNSLLLSKIEITSTTLKQYFTCPRKWLFKNVLKLAPLDNEAELIDEYILGTVNHKIFELFSQKLMFQKKPLCTGENANHLGSEYRKILIDSINEAVSLENENSAFKEIYSDSNEKITASKTTVKVIASQYKIENEALAEENPNFRTLEKSLANLCRIFTGYKIHAVEKEVQALPPENESGGVESDYYFSGKIDCILSSPNGTDFAIIDYKTSAPPSNLLVKEKEAGKIESVIDFQMPLYIYLLENNIIEDEKLNVTIAEFYSIKNAEEKPFLGQAENGKKNKITEDEVNLAIAEMLEYSKRFASEIADEKFAVDIVNQSRKVCAAKGQYKNCIDYHALCRRHFTVSGEVIRKPENEEL